MPSLVSAVPVALGLHMRLKIAGIPVFQAAVDRQERVEVPIATLLAHHWWPTPLGILAMVICYTLLYISTVSSLSYGVGTLHLLRPSFLSLLCLVVVFMGLVTPLSARASNCFGRKLVLIVSIIAAILSDFTMVSLLGSGQTLLVALFLIIGLFLTGATSAPMGVLLPGLFPTNVRYTGAGVSYNLGGILGASVAPYTAQKLTQQGDLSWVGMCVSATVVVSLIGVSCMRKMRGTRLM